MAKKSVYYQIKNQNGEGFAQAIQRYDNGIFDIPGIVDLLKYAGRKAEDAKPLLEYLESMKNIKIPETKKIQDPFKLLSSVGYEAVYADTLKKQNAIKPYFAKNEAICTFGDQKRYQLFHIINVVHERAKDLKREDFRGKEKRDDEYGTSVMSIQILKVGGNISIKNRYNHAVNNCDNTYDSNPDNIVPGLSAALKAYFNVDFSSQKVALPEGYARFGDRILKYNFERDNVYFGADFWVKYGEIHEINKSNQIMMDGVVFNTQLKDIDPSMDMLYNEKNGIGDSFFSELAAAMRGKKIRTLKTAAGDTRITINDGHGTWVDVRDGHVVGINMPGLVNVPDNFGYYLHHVREVHLPNARRIGNNFCDILAMELKTLDLPSVRQIGDNFLGNANIDEIKLPHVEKIGDDFMINNRTVKLVEMPNVREIGRGFLGNNTDLTHLVMPCVRKIGKGFMQHNVGLTTLDLPDVRKIGDRFLERNTDLTHLVMPRVENIGKDFMPLNGVLTTLDLPNVRKVGNDFLCRAKNLKQLTMPQVKKIGHGSLAGCKALTRLDLPELREIGHYVLAENTVMEYINTPRLGVIAGRPVKSESDDAQGQLQFAGILQKNPQAREMMLRSISAIKFAAAKDAVPHVVAGMSANRRNNTPDELVLAPTDKAYE